MLSVVVPILNEAKTIDHLLDQLSGKSVLGQEEIILVDGGSTDDTINRVKTYCLNHQERKIQIVHSAKGRAVQMNAGARAAKYDILYFLHADSTLPEGYDQKIMSAWQDGHGAGSFRMRFDKSHPVLGFSQWFTRFNHPMFRGGDQSLFVDRQLFFKMGGFNEDFLIYEDCEFIGRLYRQTEFTVIPDYIITSARRYSENGTWRLQYHFTVIHLKRWMGAGPDRLQQYYHRHIAS